MCVVVLITQRSQVQILPPLPSRRPVPNKEPAFCLRFVHGRCSLHASPARLSSSAWSSIPLTSNPPMIKAASVFATSRSASSFSRWPSAASGNVCVLWVASLAARSE
jgi:hypothetical protein